MSSETPPPAGDAPQSRSVGKSVLRWVVTLGCLGIIIWRLEKMRHWWSRAGVGFESPSEQQLYVLNVMTELGIVTAAVLLVALVWFFLRDRSR